MRSTLPENTDLNSLKCLLENNQLSIKAPLNLELKETQRSIPIEISDKQSKRIVENVQSKQ
jgi:hypothetical protein